MIPQHIKQYVDKLQLKNYKSFYLAFLRVVMSMWLLKEVCINWTSMEILYGNSALVVPAKNLISRLPGGGFLLVKNYYIWFILGYVVVIFMSILGIGKWFTAMLLFGMFMVLQKMNMTMLNGGDKMAMALLLYLIFADSYQYFTLFRQKRDKNDTHKLQNLLSNLAAFSMMLQLCLAYFQSSVAKAGNFFWLHGEATYYALSMERFVGTAFNKYIVQYKWIDYVSNYATLSFELLFPLLIWIKKLRKPLLITGLLFHLCIYIFLMIYGFQIVFILIYGLFLPNQQLLDFAQKCKTFFLRKKMEVTTNTP